MKKKIVGILVCMLLITGTGSFALASINIDKGVSDISPAIRGLRYDKVSGGSGFDDENIHHFCFVKAGYVGIRNVKIIGFYSAYYSNFFFCIGNVTLDLISFPSDLDETRLIVRSLFGKKMYENDISVSIIGFIGSVRQTGSVDGGYLRGFTRIIEITLL